MDDKNKELEEMCEDEDFEVIDMLLEFLRECPKPKYWLINPVNYQRFVQAELGMNQLLKNNIAKPEILVDISADFNMGSILIRADEILIEDCAKFSKMMQYADVMEIYPLTDGKIQMNITFRNILKSVF